MWLLKSTTHSSEALTIVWRQDSSGPAIGIVCVSVCLCLCVRKRKHSTSSTLHVIDVPLVCHCEKSRSYKNHHNNLGWSQFKTSKYNSHNVPQLSLSMRVKTLNTLINTERKKKKTT